MDRSRRVAEHDRLVGGAGDEPSGGGRGQVGEPEPHSEADRPHQQNNAGREHDHWRSVLLSIGLAVGLVVGAGGLLVAGLSPAEEHPRPGPQDGRSGQRRGEHDQRRHKAVAHVVGGVLDHRLAEERPERRQRGDQQTAGEEQRAGHLQLAPAPMQVLLAHLPEPMLEDADAREQERLAAAIRQHVHRGAGDAICGQQPHAGEEDADETDRDKREHALEVVLLECHRRPPQGGQQARADQDRAHDVGV